MSTFKSIRLAISLCLVLMISVSALDSLEDQSASRQKFTPEPQAFLESLVGSWEGTCRTWFRPGELADKSKVKGEFKLILGGRFLRHSYESQILGKPRTGEETIAYNAAQKNFQTSWVDDFHMNYGLLFAEGDRTESGFVVFGNYSVGQVQPLWGWKTVFEMSDKDHLIVTAYNVTPDGMEAKAVETRYTRIKL